MAESTNKEADQKMTSVAVMVEDKALLEQLRETFDPRPTMGETLGWIIRREWERRCQPAASGKGKQTK